MRSAPPSAVQRRCGEGVSGILGIGAERASDVRALEGEARGCGERRARTCCGRSGTPAARGRSRPGRPALHRAPVAGAPGPRTGCPHRISAPARCLCREGASATLWPVVTNRRTQRRGRNVRGTAPDRRSAASHGRSGRFHRSMTVRGATATGLRHAIRAVVAGCGHQEVTVNSRAPALSGGDPRTGCHGRGRGWRHPGRRDAARGGCW